MKVEEKFLEMLEEMVFDLDAANEEELKFSEYGRERTEELMYMIKLKLDL